MTQPTDQPGIDQLTSDQLDQLYARLATAEREADEAIAAAAHLTRLIGKRAAKAEATLAAVRKLHAPVNHRGRTICGHCSGYGGGSCDNGPQGHPCPT
ncbi:hypothetical protein, partial [Streptomyces sp. NPDC058664]